MATQALAASISASAIVTANFNTSQILVGGEFLLVDAPLTTNINIGGEFLLVDAPLTTDVQVGGLFLVVDAYFYEEIQVSSIYVLVDQDADTDVKISSIYVLVDQDADVDIKLGSIALLVDAIESTGESAAITASSTVTASLTVKYSLSASITATATVTADQTGPTPLSVGIVGSGTVTALLGKHQYLTTDIVTSTTVTSDLDDYKAASGSSTLTLTSNGDVYTNIRIGSTVPLRQSATLASVLNTTSTLGVTLDHNAEYDLVQSLNVEHTLVFTDEAIFKRPVEDSASSSLTLTDSAVPFRWAYSTLIFTQLAEGTIYFIEGIASNTLVFTQLAELATSVFNTTPYNVLILTQNVDYDLFTSRNVQSWLVFKQSAVGTLITSKKYMLLQAPYNFIQTSVVLPSPIFGDTENIISNINLRRAMNGLTYTYVKSSESRVLKYTFTLPRMKALELEEFCRYYNSAEIKMQNWKGEIWKVNLMTNPIDFVQTGREAPTEDRTDVSIEFEGVKISG